MILEALLLIIIIFAVQIAKNKYPNFLFFPKGAVLFMPPEETQVQEKPKKKKDKKPNELSVIKVQYDNVKEYPFANELSRVLMTAAVLVIIVLLRIVIDLFFPLDGLLTFYILAAIIVYTLKLGVETFLLTNYNRKVCFAIALGLNFFFMALFVVMEQYEGVYDQTISRITRDYVKHLEIIFNRQMTYITARSVMGVVLVFNFFVTLAVIPAVIKFGNWYTKTLKELYYEDDGEDSLPVTKRAGREDVDEKEQEANLKYETKLIIWKLNFYLAFMLAVIALSHRYFLTFLSETHIDLLRGVCLGVCIYCICSTMASAIEFNGSFGYKYVMDYFEEENAEKRAELRKKIVSYIYYIWYHYFQFVVRLLVPLLAFLLVVNWKYLVFEESIVSQPLTERPLNADIECPINTDQLLILENLYRCPVNAVVHSNEHRFFLSGSIETIPANLPAPRLQENMQKYAILDQDIMVEISEQFFWYSGLTIYLMTVSYILFLRKTVYDL
jgi:hypothetical protein